MTDKPSRRDVFKWASAAGAGFALGGASAKGETMQKSHASNEPPVSRPFPEGTVPLVAVEGTAYECGRQYAEIVHRQYPGYRRYLDQALDWRSLPGGVRKLFERRAPYMLDVYRGMIEVDDVKRAAPASAPEAGGCTSFSVSGSLTLDGEPISGQNKETVLASAALYVVLRMRIKGGPTLLTLVYPGEVLGYGMWSTGMSLFRNALYSTAGAERGLTMEQWGLLALAGGSVEEAVELVEAHGMSTVANCLISDRTGKSCNVESNVGGVSVVPARDGIATHANHPVGKKTAPCEDYPDPVEKRASRWRAEGLRQLIEAERGRLTAQKAMMFLADHTHYPRGICRHGAGSDGQLWTTAAVVAEPTRGQIHVTRGHPCSNWLVTYTL